MLAIPKIHVMRPMLPSAERIAPYLQKIDAARVYSNYGPLARALEDRLVHHYGLSAGTVTTVANCTLGLMLALNAQGAEPGALCVVPAWTFVASAHAVRMAGLVPYFVDVSPETWSLDVAAVEHAIHSAPRPVGAVMAVAPFGRPIDVKAWDDFRLRTGLPVVIDAAAGFDAITPGATPAVISLHATKVIGCGEGGFVMSSDAPLVREIRTRANFGFFGSRQALVPATNAKLSEYHAAVGLAALDEWPDARGQWMERAQVYRSVFSESNNIHLQEEFGRSWVASTCVVRFSDSAAERPERELANAGIETRRWWARGAHEHPATLAMPRTDAPQTEMLAHSTLGLPFYRDLDVAVIDEIGKITTAATRL
jgi:dTDP-4-amino-4,6-dideoxygalactose transaminase